MSLATPAIQVENISKRFKNLQALNGVSFDVPRDSVFCILGPNGAGKTTLLRILTSVTHPDSGRAAIEGHDIFKDTLATRQLIGVVAQENRFDRYLSVWHNLTMHAQMHGLSRREYEARVTELLEQSGLYDRRFSPPDELSGGMQRRITLIRALIHRPKVLFLDEPTTGLDPEARLDVWKTIEQFKKNATVVLTTHYLEEADRLSDRILLLRQGQVVREGTARELKQDLSPLNRYELVLKSPHAQPLRDSLIGLCEANEGLHHLEVCDAYTLRFQVREPEVLKHLFTHLDPADLQRLGVVEAELEDVFMALAGKATLAKGVPQ